MRQQGAQKQRKSEKKRVDVGYAVADISQVIPQSRNVVKRGPMCIMVVHGRPLYCKHPTPTSTAIIGKCKGFTVLALIPPGTNRRRGGPRNDRPQSQHVLITVEVVARDFNNEAAVAVTTH